jgi:predicted small lipoprotein YifL
MSKPCDCGGLPPCPDCKPSKWMWRWFLLILTVAFLLALAACGEGGPTKFYRGQSVAADVQLDRENPCRIHIGLHHSPNVPAMTALVEGCSVVEKSGQFAKEISKLTNIGKEPVTVPLSAIDKPDECVISVLGVPVFMDCDDVR